MSKRSKVKSLHTSLRLAPDVADAIEKASTATGWSNARVVSQLVRVGLAAAAGKRDLVAGLVDAYEVAVNIHRVELDNARRLADARKALRTPVAGKGSRPGTTAAAKAARKPAVKVPPPAGPNAAA